MTQAPEGGAREAAARLGQDTADLVRAEVERRRDDLMATVWRSSTALALFGGAAGCGLLAVAMGEVAVLRGLEKVMPRGRAALVLTTFHVASAVGLALAGRRAMERAGAAAQAALDKTSDDVRSARDEAASAGPDLPI
ncbi:MAG: phage holin family protein [Intrasporangium sp.]|uniref:phage holin family protein n=1 Tax=Intrasporangium sp. TaxID=1925024 RepID=UPI003F7FE8A9